jgi:hypothetical protein
MVLSLMLLAGVIQAQTVIAATNRIAPTEAVKIASGLRLGMAEADAAKFLEAHGVTSGFLDTKRQVYVYTLSVGSCTGWSTGYPLAGGYILSLNMEPRKTNGLVTMNGRWGGNGLLTGASIQSNCVTIASITLTNKP